PLACECLRVRRIEPHQQVELAFRSWKPVGLFVCARIFILYIKIERSIGVVFQGHPATEVKAVKGISNLKTLRIIESNRPEGAYWRRLAFVEVECVFVRTIEWLASLVAKIGWIYGVLWKICAETPLGDDRSLQIVIAVDPHCICVQ